VSIAGVLPISLEVSHTHVQRDTCYIPCTKHPAAGQMAIQLGTTVASHIHWQTIVAAAGNVSGPREGDQKP
jgi:hypothetical protein